MERRVRSRARDHRVTPRGQQLRAVVVRRQFGIELRAGPGERRRRALQGGCAAQHNERQSHSTTHSFLQAGERQNQVQAGKYVPYLKFGSLGYGGETKGGSTLLFSF